MFIIWCQCQAWSAYIYCVSIQVDDDSCGPSYSLILFLSSVNVGHCGDCSVQFAARGDLFSISIPMVYVDFRCGELLRSSC